MRGQRVCNNGGEMSSVWFLWLVLPRQAKPATQCLFGLGCAGRRVAGSGDWGLAGWRVGGGGSVREHIARLTGWDDVVSGLVDDGMNFDMCPYPLRDDDCCRSNQAMLLRATSLQVCSASRVSSRRRDPAVGCPGGDAIKTWTWLRAQMMASG
ncbi:hypothetical protein QBC39DRAFT_145500 [Podospora conica]|nr:hypothetical protein QBC39DRAFT_145500 [Schizothecium conicum]